MKRIFSVLILIALASGALLGWVIWKCQDDRCLIFEWQKIQAADSFERCANLGFPVIKLYPRQCRAGTKSFTEGAGKVENSTSQNPIVPKQVLAAVQAAVAEKLKIREDEVAIIGAYQKEWPNSCLGLAPAGYGCEEVITPGYEVTAQAGTQQFVYRTNIDGVVVKEQ